MTILVVGASGATGQLLLKELLNRDQEVRAVVRMPERLPLDIRSNPLLSVTQAGLLDLSDKQLQHLVHGCTAVASCLGHNLTFKGLFGAPRKLVTDAASRLCQAVKANGPDSPIRFVLMNTAGNRNRGANEPVSLGHRVAVGLIRWLLPPHADNEQAADYLRTQLGQNDGTIEWAVVRPDTLTNEKDATEYDTHPSPTRSAIFNPGQTSRANVAHFMADLVLNDDSWHQWKGRMPVIYNKGHSH